MADVTLSNYWDNTQLAAVATTPLTEHATLVVGGVRYNNWKTVRVKLEVGNPFQEFQFSVAEPIDINSDFADWRIQVGDRCQVELAGIMVIDGTVEIREGAYDRNNHGVMFFGRSNGAHASDGSVHMRNDNQTISGTFSAIVGKALEGTCVGLSVGPGVDNLVFPNFSINFGETPWHVAERLARFIPGLRVTDNGAGTWLADIVETAAPTNVTFLEGENILEARATIDITRRMSFIDVRMQNSNQNDESPASQNEVEGSCSDPTVEACRWMCIAGEEPGTQAMAQGRAQQELAHNAEEIVHADIKVYGWFASPGTLFNIYKQYGINSPMLNLKRFDLWSRVVTFEQNEEGTFTTIELCTRESLTGQLDVNAPAQQVSDVSQGAYYGQGVTQQALQQSGAFTAAGNASQTPDQAHAAAVQNATTITSGTG